MDDFFKAVALENESALFALMSTDAVFVNDKWDLNSKLNFNVGLRYDASEGKNQSHVKTVDDTAISPRLGLTYEYEW